MTEPHLSGRITSQRETLTCDSRTEICPSNCCNGLLGDDRMKLMVEWWQCHVLFSLNSSGVGPFLFHGRWVQLIEVIRVSRRGCCHSKGRLGWQRGADGNSEEQSFFDLLTEGWDVLRNFFTLSQGLVGDLLTLVWPGCGSNLGFVVCYLLSILFWKVWSRCSDVIGGIIVVIG